MDEEDLLLEKQSSVPLLEMEKVSFSYRKREFVCSNFSLTLWPGRVYGLLGLNGIGKTTLMKLMTSLLFPNSGTVRFRGTNVSRRYPSVMREIFFVPEEVELPHLTLKRFVESYGSFYSHFDELVLDEWLGRFQIECKGKLDKLLMGDRKKIYLSFAMATGCPFLLMDEPTNGLDILAKGEFKRLVASYMDADRTVLISTHQGHEIEQILDHLIVLDSSGLALEASLSEIAGKMSFEMCAKAELPEDTLFSEPTFGGLKVLRPNTGRGAESEVDVEFLFKGIMYNPDGIREAMQREEDLKNESI